MTTVGVLAVLDLSLTITVDAHAFFFSGREVQSICITCALTTKLDFNDFGAALTAKGSDTKMTAITRSAVQGRMPAAKII